MLDKDDVDLSDVDDFPTLPPIQKRAVLHDMVMQEYGHVDLETVCEVDLYLMAWAIRRRHRLQAIHQARATKRDHQLDSSPRGLSKEGLISVDAFKQFYANCGIAVMEMDCSAPVVQIHGCEDQPN